LIFTWYHDIIETVRKQQMEENRGGWDYGKEIGQLQKDGTVFAEDL